MPCVQTSRRAASLVGIMLAATSGCCEDGFLEVQQIAIDSHGALRGVAADYGGRYFIIDAGGYVTSLDTLEEKRGYEIHVIDEAQISSHPLVAITVANFGDDSIWVVDEAGVVFESRDAGWTWGSHPLDAGLVPRGILIREAFRGQSYVVVYGDGFVRVRQLAGDEWQEPEAPDGDWGLLRAHTAWPHELLLSDGADLLIADDPLEPWQRVDAPTDVLAVGTSWSGYHPIRYIIGGREGMLIETSADDQWDEVTWTRIHEGLTDADVVAIDDRWVLTDAGELIDLNTSSVLEVGDARAGLAGDFGEVVVFGANGPVLTTRWEVCSLLY